MSLASALAEAMAPRCFVPGCNRPSVWHELCVLHAAEEVAAEREIEETRRVEEALMDLYAEEARITAELAAPRPRPVVTRTPDWQVRADAYGQAAARNILERFTADVARGRGRNNALNAAAWALGRLAAGEVIDEAEAVALVEQAGESVGLPVSEVRSIVRHTICRAAERPASIPTDDAGRTRIPTPRLPTPRLPVPRLSVPRVPSPWRPA